MFSVPRVTMKAGSPMPVTRRRLVTHHQGSGRGSRSAVPTHSHRRPTRQAAPILTGGWTHLAAPPLRPTRAPSCLKDAVRLLPIRSPRHSARAGSGPDRERLVDLELTAFKSQRRAPQVQSPHSRAACTSEPDRLGVALLEVAHPGPQGQRIVLAQILDVADLQTGVLDGCDDRADL